MQKDKQNQYEKLLLKKIQDENLRFDHFSESTPVSTKNVPMINYFNCGRMQEDVFHMNLPQQNNVSFVTQGSKKVMKKPSNKTITGPVNGKSGSNLNKSQNRDGSVNSDKVNNSILKLKSRNRCNENLSLAIGQDNTQARQIYPGIMEHINYTVKPKLSEQQQMTYQQMTTTQSRIKTGTNMFIEKETLNSTLKDVISSSNNSAERQYENQNDQVCANQSIHSKAIKKVILPIEPQSCQNKVQKEKLMFLKNIGTTQKTSSSQVATPKYLKFKQKTQAPKGQSRQQSSQKNMYQQTQKANDDYGQLNLQIDNSFTTKSPLEVNKGQKILQSKIMLKGSSQKERDINNISAITQEKSSFLFSHEKVKKNLSQEEDREEMSTTINCTSNNEVSLFPEEQCSPNNQIPMKQKIQTQSNKVIAKKKLSHSKRRTEDPSSPNNQRNKCNQSFQFGYSSSNNRTTQIGITSSHGRVGSNGSGQRSKKKRKGNGSGQHSNLISQSDQHQHVNLSQTTHLSKAGINFAALIKSQTKKFQQSSNPKGSCKSSRSNSVKKDLKSLSKLRATAGISRGDSNTALIHEHDYGTQVIPKHVLTAVNNYMMTDYEEQDRINQMLNKKKSSKNQDISAGTFSEYQTRTQQQVKKNETKITNETKDGAQTLSSSGENTKNCYTQPYDHYETFNMNPQKNQVYPQEEQKEQEIQLGFQNIQEIETMKRELRNKDILIQNLRERLVTLEEKVNGIQREEQRDKSQQRIKEAIHSLEEKLEQFRMERELNNQKLEEIKLFSSLHSSSRASEQQQLMNHNQNSKHRRNNHQQSQNSILDDLESLITIADGDDFIQKSIRTPMFEDKYLNIIAQDGDILSDGQQDNSCLLMLEKEWQEQQNNINVLDQSHINPQNVFFLEDDTTLMEEDDIHYAVTSKEKFVKTQKIVLSNKDCVVEPASFKGCADKDDKKNSIKQRNGSFSKTFSKTNLLNKIRNAMGQKGIDLKNGKVTAVDGQNQKKTPRRFIVKRSQERNNPSSNVNLKQKITIIPNQNALTSATLETQEVDMKSIISQKKKFVQNQQDALKKERELSVKLRQAIQKLNLKAKQTTAVAVNAKNYE